MIQSLESSVGLVDEPPVREARPLTVWGLTPRDLHDAFWAARGVQCVRRGCPCPLQRGAELYMLLEPEQFVLLDLAALSERLTWHNALVTRLRVTERDDESYTERVVTDDDGRVQCIERAYGDWGRGSSRVILTPSRRVAQMWLDAASPRAAWDRVRRSVPWARVDHWRCGGRTYVDGDPTQMRELMTDLVERWPTPAQAIDGLEEIEAGVWQVADADPRSPGVRVGPLWLGQGTGEIEHPCLVGPGWVEDSEPVTGVAVRSISHVELAESTVLEPESGPGATYQWLKRLIDVTVSGIAVLATLPVMLVIACLILLEDGRPIFFGHVRQGRGGRRFTCWKFRTMHVNAESIARDLADYNICDGPQVFIRDDPRVTRIGGLLRRAHVDELPQLFNVLFGQMSLVGPRPSPDDENQFCPAWRDLRLSVRPGITGLWQLERTRRPGEDFQEWIRFDIEYVRRASLWTDLQIMARTGWMVLSGR
jgi:lipopolysaccharide/colanic/teichoic acid biosynthesis glycosyltransferase